MKNCRIFVEKKEGFDLEAKRLCKEWKEALQLNSLTKVRILNCYDIFGAKDIKEAKRMIFSEVVTDVVSESFDEKIPHFAVEFLPGQFDQRADSAYQCMNLLSAENEKVVITSGKVFLLEGNVSSEEIEKIKKFYINPVEMREKDLSKLEQEGLQFQSSVPIIESFVGLKESMGLAMSQADLDFVEKYFREEEKRMPTETEIRVLDTYWSDHCRHTTFETELEEIVFPKGKFGEELQRVFNKYLANKQVTLMEMAKVIGKKMRKEGKLDDLEVSEEINACSIYIDVDVDGEIEKWLLMFKNETHNHPTEIEPFGGASTCLGGAIRDPLSGRAYVYQAIRVTGAANPLETLEDTLEGKLPQKKITTAAAHGYSSYGNQIGLTTGLVSEIYHEGYKAKRMEVGAVVAAAPVKNVRRETPIPGDIVILLGGKTGRDGCGGATGSSKEHTKDSLALCGAEVQKGNAPEERKIQRLFRKEKVARMIKKCNDFGAGGVSVAIGELAEGLKINLDSVPTKYAGLNGTELAISESQERMAVVIAKEEEALFLEEAAFENLEATKVAEVTEEKRLILSWKGKEIVNLSRAFVDTNGVRQKAKVEVEEPSGNNPLTEAVVSGNSLADQWKNCMQDLNVASQKGMVEMFDSNIGAGTILMPFGGKYQMTPNDVAVQKISVEKGHSHTASAITWGYNPKISSWSPYHGSAYAVLESLAKLVSVGADYRKVRLSFQEYFQKLGKEAKNWGKPFAALLGSLEAQEAFGTPAIGGKDSMSGSFQDLHVPPTLISFAVAPVATKEVISPEFKKAASHIYLLKHTALENAMPDYEMCKKNFTWLHEQIIAGNILSCMTIKMGGIAEALTKMTFGNRIGLEVKNVGENFFQLAYGSFILESEQELSFDNLEYLGKTIEEYQIRILDRETSTVLSGKEMEKEWLEVLAPIFPYEYQEEKKEIYTLDSCITTKIYHSKERVAKPRVLVMAFPGTNCEYDSAKAFQDAGAEPHILVFRNLKPSYIEASIEAMVQELKQAQILMLPGGFSAGDEPDGSGKFIATVLQNPRIMAEVQNFLERDGLILGICNGFQALIKSGLLPYGKLGTVTENSPTLTFNKIGRHVSQMVRTKILSNQSPWLSSFQVGEEFIIPVSHGEGRFYVQEAELKSLLQHGQIVTQYVNFEGKASNEFRHTPNGSTCAIEGIVSPDGRILGKMGHSERKGEDLYKNIPGNKVQDIFSNGVNYFK
ncbi:phosphoribosylformylglycinamidine synthase [Fusobacterium necrophorum subsp. funduliforme ATCC 51357]|uniref:Phosphoribosylformylglycinamidine synthase n=3 Tax=Fusobacterium necrophorum TaxID=859 RepID=A0A162JCQ4_9FUSO|nr:phosphoribosylformylglycinamidine synthase [Fusobacterium necrophorum]AYV93084.1 phosphoribosylformylglycinamidine synthase [Fusobacterium necrophorum subsp. funduliforme]EIJ67563.1 phosphoribosylformylglycinamidine synthase [Fusobacterium necrophorum subsp. funduliforme ATCC 51357]KAB0554217.1 phosphoribosylformylglycinamidine synthase [Fusobacterium necrophorum subsp. funduliforme]KYL05541.1 phosphoribosylformylglycinamidine synthase [Fusobacterium necrophorum subsp. funduliforme]KYM45454